MKKKFNFDKFVKDIDKRSKSQKQKEQDRIEADMNLPQRRYNHLYRELWQNSVKYGKKK
jgi:hypothetical protein|tara:strand:- start:81 stop:257 length:177 start_codon:yes stop_codon:yes gene_type:complete